MNEDTFYYNSLDLLRSMIRLPSSSREEAGVPELLAGYLKTYCPDVRRKGNNVWVCSPGMTPEKPTVLLNSHIDTVRPVEGWTMDPYTPVESGGRLYGLGSNDAGASVVSLLHAFLLLIQKEQAYNLIFLASAEEEVSGEGGIESVLEELPAIDFAIVGEPTGMNPAIAEKGLMVLDCTVNGRSGHAARDEGENAIYKAMDCIGWFRDYEFPLISRLLGRVKMSVTLIRSGTQHNVIPGQCEFTVDVRSNELYDNRTLFQFIREHCGCDEVKARSFRLNPSSIPDDHPVVVRALMMGKTAFGSPALSDQALLPFPSLKIGPGESSRSHTADEYICPDEIREAIDVYVRLLDGLRVKPDNMLKLT